MSDCSALTSQSACVAPTTSVGGCVWLNNVCVADPCTSRTTMESCGANDNCVGVNFQTGSTNSVLCFAMQRVCSQLSNTGPDTCQKFDWCLPAAGSEACNYYVPGIGRDGQSTESCLSFPMWSIALIVLWILVMLILGAIVALALRQKRLDAIEAVEESEVYVESVHVRDNFSPRSELDKPLNRDDY